MRRAALAILFCLTLAAAARAQELDVFDINDFVDPRELGSEVSRGRLLCPCDSLLVARAMAGAVADYVDVQRTTHADVSFGHLAVSYYRGPWQANWKRTQFHREDFGVHGRPSWLTDSRLTAPENRNIVQVGRYLAIGPASSPSIVRVELTWTQVEYRQEGPRRRQPDGSVRAELFSEYSREVGVEADIPYEIFGQPVVTSLVIVQRSGAYDMGARRVSLLQRLPRIAVGRWSVDVSAAAGALRISDYTGLTVHPSVHVISPTIPFADMRVHVKYAPSLQRTIDRWQTTNQIAVFVDRALFAKRFRSRARQRQ